MLNISGLPTFSIKAYMKTIKALIADDDGITRHILRSMLRQHEIDVVGEATDGTDVSAMCANLLPDILFLDINMPKMSGFEVLNNFCTEHPGIAIIMMSSDATLSNVEATRSYGVLNFVVKPFNAARVIDAIVLALKTDKHDTDANSP